MTKPLNNVRKLPTQERATATFIAIVDAAAHILVQSGPKALTTNKIAARAGVSIGSLYQYFPNKQAIVRALLEREVARAEAIRPAVLDEHDASRSVVVRAAVDWWCEIHAMDPVLSRHLRSLAEEHLPVDELRRLGELRRDRLQATIARLLGDTGAGRLRHAAFIVDTCLGAITDRAQIRQPKWLGSADFRQEVTLLLERYLQ